MRLPFFCLLATFLLLTATPALAQKPIALFSYDNKPPLAWLEDGQPKGIYIDILHQIEKRTGLTFEISLLPWKRAYMLAQDSKGGIFGLSKNKDRLRIFDYSALLYVDEMRLVVLRGHEFDYNSVEDLRGKTVGVTRGASYGDVFDKARATVFTPSEDANPISRLRMLLAERIDVALMGPGEASVHHVINQDQELTLNRDMFVILETPFNEDANYIGFNKTLCQGKTLDKINAALQAMREDGTIERIEKRY